MDCGIHAVISGFIVCSDKWKTLQKTLCWQHLISLTSKKGKTYPKKALQQMERAQGCQPVGPSSTALCTWPRMCTQGCSQPRRQPGVKRRPVKSQCIPATEHYTVVKRNVVMLQCSGMEWPPTLTKQKSRMLNNTWHAVKPFVFFSKRSGKLCVFPRLFAVLPLGKELGSRGVVSRNLAFLF